MSTYIIIFVDLFSFIYNANQMPGHLIRPKKNFGWWYGCIFEYPYPEPPVNKHQPNRLVKNVMKQ